MMVFRRLPLSAKVFLVCGLWLVALGLYFILLRPALLPEDPRSIGSSIEAIRAAVPGLEHWLGHVLNVMGGFMVASGALTALAACRFLAKCKRGTFGALTVAGAASVGRHELSFEFGLSMAATGARALVAFWPGVLSRGALICRNSNTCLPRLSEVQAWAWTGQGT